MIIPTVMGSMPTGYEFTSHQYEFTSLQPADINWDEIETEKNIYQPIVKRKDNSPVTISPIYGLGIDVDEIKWGIRSNGMVYKTPYWVTNPFLTQTTVYFTVTATYNGDTIYNTVMVKILPEPLIIKPSANIQEINENSGKDQLLYTAVAEWQGWERNPMADSLSRTHGLVKSSDATFSLGPDSDQAISIDKDSGEVRLTIDPDFETKGLYFYSVKATLPGSPYGVLESNFRHLSLSILDDFNEPVLGCTNPSGQSNYNELANTDNGSCKACVYGCMDTNAYNVDPAATCDNGSCIPCVYGCMDTNAYNYNAEFTCPDSSCKVCDQLKINYNSDDCLGACGSKSALCEGYKTDYDTNCGCSS